MDFRKDIEGLRGIAVLFVLFYHLYPNIISGGYIGVDIFFSISGFLVCYSIEKRIIKEKKKFYFSFYSARLRRLLPSSLFVILFIALYIMKYDTTYFSKFERDARSCLFFYANYNFYFNKVDYFRSRIKESPLLHYWSLSLEEQFYILSPILLYSFFDKIMYLYILLSILSFSFCLYYGFRNINKGYFFLSSRSWEFIISALIRHTKFNINMRCNNYSNYISLIVLFFLSLCYNGKTLYPSYNSLFPILATLVLLYSSNTNNILSHTAISYIGNLSYLIYLYHYPIQIIFNSVSFTYYSFLILLVYFSHYIIEMPFYRGILKLSEFYTYILSLISIILLFITLTKLKVKINIKLKYMKHRTSFELSEELKHFIQLYCCINSYEFTKSAILFIGDSHIQQYIIALVASKYRNKYQLIHLYIPRWKYKNKLLNSILYKLIKEYYFSLCLIGNFMEFYKIYIHIERILGNVKSMCKVVLLSNDNPHHNVDPNECINMNRSSCYGIVNKTCIVPPKFSLKINISNIYTVNLWYEDIINYNKCFYYYKNIPIYADKDHFSLPYLKLLINRLLNILQKYNILSYNFTYKYMNSCSYYLLQSFSYHFPNFNGKVC